jgi:predicted membrane protein
MRGSEWGWDLYLNPQTPLDLNINMGAGSVELDLSALQVTDLDVDLGVGRTEVIFPDVSEPINASINGAIGEMIVYIPSSKSVRVTSNTGLAVIDVPDGYTQDGDVYVYNGDGADPDNRVDLNVDQAIGRISIRTR